MDISGLWEACEMTSKICGVIERLKSEAQYTREDAVDDLEEFLLNHMEPVFSTVFIIDREPSENENFAFEEERRLRQLGELREEKEGSE